MQFSVQRRLAAQLLKCSPKRVYFDSEALSDVKEAITKADIRSLIKRRAISEIPSRKTSRGRAREAHEQRKKGRRRGQGSRKGRASARLNSKDTWVAMARLQRAFVKDLRARELINQEAFRELYLKIKGGFFRNKRHIKLFIEENGMVKK